MSQFNPTRANKFLRVLANNRHIVRRYVNYWDNDVGVRGDNDRFLRWIFALLSVKAAWKQNYLAYLAIEDQMNRCGGFIPSYLPADLNRATYNPNADKNLAHPDEPGDGLWEAVTKTGVGLQAPRHRGITELAADYRIDPSEFDKKCTETLSQARDRIAGRVHGLGLAKAAFGFEMIYPRNRSVVCLDTHMAQLYDVEPEALSKKPLYHEIEHHWCGVCRQLGLPSPIARHVYFDLRQRQASTRYWSFVFEPNHSNVSPYLENQVCLSEPGVEELILLSS